MLNNMMSYLLPRLNRGLMRTFPVSPTGILSSLWQNLDLVKVLVSREIVGRYKGSLLGLLWAFFNPLFMLAVYTFVFSVVFKSRWGAGSTTDSRAEFALVLFAGMLMFNLLAECLNRAPSLILINTTYVKKVVFPLEILPWVSLGTALFHTGVSFGVWLLFFIVVFGPPPVTIMLFPLLMVPFCLLIMGLSWLLASLGVYLRDVGQVIGILTTALMFLTPIFYPISSIPETYRTILLFNPLTFIVDQARDLLIFGKGMAWKPFFVLTICSLGVAWLGYAWFQKTRKGFADVL